MFGVKDQLAGDRFQFILVAITREELLLGHRALASPQQISQKREQRTVDRVFLWLRQCVRCMENRQRLDGLMSDNRRLYVSPYFTSSAPLSEHAHGGKKYADTKHQGRDTRGSRHDAGERLGRHRHRHPTQHRAHADRDKDPP